VREEFAVAALQLPIRGRVVSLDVPREMRALIARDILLQAAFVRRTGRTLISPRGFARSIAERAIGSNADAHQGRLWRERLAENIETADDLSTDSREVGLGELLRRLFEGREPDGSSVKGSRWEALWKTPWHVADHQPHAGCPACDALAAGDADTFLVETGVPEVVLRILHAEMVLARVLPPYRLRSDGPLTRRADLPEL
jgi:hypothetical protein